MQVFWFAVFLCAVIGGVLSLAMVVVNEDNPVACRRWQITSIACGTAVAIDLVIHTAFKATSHL